MTKSAKSVFSNDDTGQQLKMEDPKLNWTSYSYVDAFQACGSLGMSANAYLAARGTPECCGFRHAINAPGVYTKYGQEMLSVTDVVSLI